MTMLMLLERHDGGEQVRRINERMSMKTQVLSIPVLTAVGIMDPAVL